MGSTPIYGIPFADPTDLVRDWPALSEDVALAIEQALEDIPVREKRIEAFTGSGTWTVPAGVTYAIAHMLGGGGGVGTSGATAGGSSSVAFASGTVEALGGLAQNISSINQNTFATSVQANSGAGALLGGGSVARIEWQSSGTYGVSGNRIVAGASVTPAASINVTVGAGGSAGTNGAAGGSGFVYIEYYEEV